jgi:hypothetical protein
MTWLGLAAGAVLALFAAFLYLAWYLRWEQGETQGLAYYGRSRAERQALKARIRRYSRPILPFVRLLARLQRSRATMPAFEFEGVAGPARVSSPAVFARARQYAPRPEDVFVVTQMRCGTTWMQQAVHQVITRGRGEFGDGPGGHLYAISPWIDAVNSVSIDDAPLVGDRPTRIIKCHLPTVLCPYSPEARFIYVTRHPVSCFASIVDFNRSMLGPLMPPVAAMADWFCSDRMYWLPWPTHVAAWWEWAERRDNVLFVHFEDMKADFGAVLERLGRFLGVALADSERSAAIAKCTFQYMKEHEEAFEMAPPTMFSVAGGRFLATGAAARHDDVTTEIRQRILRYCREALAGRSYPAARFYPDLAADGRPAPSDGGRQSR